MDEKQRYKLSAILEDLQDRASKGGVPDISGLSQFTDYIRSLYPELYDNRTLDQE